MKISKAVKDGPINYSADYENIFAKKVSGEQALWLAIIEQAVFDLKNLLIINTQPPPRIKIKDESDESYDAYLSRRKVLRESYISNRFYKANLIIEQAKSDHFKIVCENAGLDHSYILKGIKNIFYKRNLQK